MNIKKYNVTCNHGSKHKRNMYGWATFASISSVSDSVRVVTTWHPQVALKNRPRDAFVFRMTTNPNTNYKTINHNNEWLLMITYE